MKCTNKYHGKNGTFNCGSGCLACRVNYTQMWSLRLLYEFSSRMKDGASFITLTYNSENLPKDFGLHKEELQKFWKRLRVNMQREYHEFTPKITYYACGEYGESQKIYFSPGATKPHGRPHFHAIVFGLDNYNDKHRDILKQSWTLCEPWLFDKDRGEESQMLPILPERISYTTGYVQKKLGGELGRETYGESTPPFSTQSNGLGLEFAMENKERLVNNGYTVFNGNKVLLPRYFADKFEVKRTDYIKDTSFDDNEVLEAAKQEFREFTLDMKNKYGIDYSNLTLENINDYPLMARRFSTWYSDKQRGVTKEVFDEYYKMLKLKGIKI